MQRLFAAAIGSVVLMMAVGTAAAQSSEGFDGLSLSGGAGSWQCNKIRIPANAGSPSVLITGTSTNCSAGGCSNATGDADLYVYNSTATGSAPGTTAGGWTCRPYVTGNEESCSVSSTTSDKYYWACVHAYTAITPIQLRAKYTYGTPGVEGATASDGSSVEYMDYWKNNLFLGLAYHRIGCLTGSTAVLSSQDYDGFSDGDYCRAGYGWQSPSQFGGSTSYQISLNLEGIYGTQSFGTMKANADKCANGGTLSDGRVVGGTNVAYNTPGFSYRSQVCSYNVLTNCNSDCWIKNFSNCLDGSGGSGISIASPCW
ncbi:MAG TPA: PPC domain-containing protein [Kofleriaceae bacterium]|nr:PPC domain-containing protein [Kofleriaceae bacterium]